jgi:transposase-like protein
MGANLTDTIFSDEQAARAYIEAIRWPDGRACPLCGSVNNLTLLKGKTSRPGLYKCKGCRRAFTITMSTIYERSHVPLNKWLLAIQLTVSNEHGVHATQLQEALGLGWYGAALSIAHRSDAFLALTAGMRGRGGVFNIRVITSSKRSESSSSKAISSARRPRFLIA